MFQIVFFKVLTRYVASQIDTNVSEERAASVFRVNIEKGKVTAIRLRVMM
jgi:hypothetical protein